MTDEERAAAEETAAEKAEADKAEADKAEATTAAAAAEMAKAKARAEAEKKAARSLTVADMADLETSAVQRTTEAVLAKLGGSKTEAPAVAKKKDGPGVLVGVLIGIAALVTLAAAAALAAFRRKGA